MPKQEQLNRYAEVLVRIGLNVQSGQPVSIRSPLEAAEFARILVAKSYEAGAATVHVDWQDPLTKKIRLQMEAGENLVKVPQWTVQKAEEQCGQNTAFLFIAAEDPDLLSEIDPKRVALFTKAQRAATKEVDKNFMEDRVTWLVCSIPTVKWAKKIFPEAEDHAAVEKLWAAIFKALRIDQANPRAAWQQHLEHLESRADFLNKKRFESLHYRSAGTDLRVELPERHIWLAARNKNGRGTWFVANMPTEEVYTLPKRDGVNGVVRSTMALSYQGVTIEGIELTFANGRIVNYTAKSGYDTLKELIATDEGSHYLGEVALVPVDSPISQMRTLFYNTLFDENAACHLAIGEAYPTCLEGGKDMTKAELLQHGANDSLVHVDFMVGAKDLDIDGILPGGAVVPIFRRGEWVV